MNLLAGRLKNRSLKKRKQEKFSFQTNVFTHVHPSSHQKDFEAAVLRGKKLYDVALTEQRVIILLMGESKTVTIWKSGESDYYTM